MGDKTDPWEMQLLFTKWKTISLVEHYRYGTNWEKQDMDKEREEKMLRK